jgi:predicted enzyme related to lactoylglutathione lyase
MNSVTHFEIYGEEPDGLANVYQNVFGGQIEKNEPRLK